MARGETIAGLDIGTTKTCAVIAASGPEGLEIIGVGEAPSTGMRKGVVTDLEATVHAIEQATEKAERMAGVHVSQVYVGVTGEHMQSTNNRGVVAVTGEDREVISNDVKRVVDASKIINLAADRRVPLDRRRRGRFRRLLRSLCGSFLWTRVDDVVGDRSPNHNISWWK